MKSPTINCQECGKQVLKINLSQKFCGSFKEKTGCSYKVRSAYHRNYAIKRSRRESLSIKLIKENESVTH